MWFYKFDVVCEIVKQARPLRASTVCDRKELCLNDGVLESLMDVWDRELAAIDDSLVQIPLEDLK